MDHTESAKALKLSEMLPVTFMIKIGPVKPLNKKSMFCVKESSSSFGTERETNQVPKLEA